jgi:hypothetical protein
VLSSLKCCVDGGERAPRERIRERAEKRVSLAMALAGDIENNNKAQSRCDAENNKNSWLGARQRELSFESIL